MVYRLLLLILPFALATQNQKCISLVPLTIFDVGPLANGSVTAEKLCPGDDILNCGALLVASKKFDVNYTDFNKDWAATGRPKAEFCLDLQKKVNESNDAVLIVVDTFANETCNFTQFSSGSVFLLELTIDKKYKIFGEEFSSWNKVVDRLKAELTEAVEAKDVAYEKNRNFWIYVLMVVSAIGLISLLVAITLIPYIRKRNKKSERNDSLAAVKFKVSPSESSDNLETCLTKKDISQLVQAMEFYGRTCQLTPVDAFFVLSSDDVIAEPPHKKEDTQVEHALPQLLADYVPWIELIQPTERTSKDNFLGFGCRAACDIEESRLVALYLGPLVPPQVDGEYGIEARNFAKVCSTKVGEYAMEGSYNGANCLILGDTASAKVRNVFPAQHNVLIDGEKTESIGKAALINAACCACATCHFRNVTIFGKHFIGLFSVTKVEEGTELFTNYGDAYFSNRDCFCLKCGKKL